MGFSFASVVLSYFLIAGGTFFAALFSGRIGIHSEYLGYIVLALGGFVGGMVAARASKGSTVIEPGIGAALLLGSVIALGLAGSHSDAQLMLLPGAMKTIALTAAASAGGGIAGAFVTERLFGDSDPAPMSWVLYVGLATFGAAVMGTVIAGVVTGDDNGSLMGILALCCLAVGVSSGASARSRPLGASFLGGVLGLGGFGMMTIYILRSAFGGGGGETGTIPPEMYAGMAVLAAGAGMVAMIGALIGWKAVGSRQ